jgi:ATP-dependent RNA helicase RhlB
MDFQRFGIDPRLAQAAEGLPTNFFFYEKMLTHVVDGQENVCVKITLDEGREEVLLLPALQWLLVGQNRRVLVVVPDDASATRCAAAIERLGSGAGINVCRVRHDDAADPALRLEGDASSSVLIGALEDLLVAPGLQLRDYGFLVVDGVDRLVDLPSDAIRKFCAALLPSWERRSVLACARISVKAKNLAWDLADNPSELIIEGEVAKAQSVLKETWNVPVESKLKFLLGLLAREKPARLCVFCNIKDTASEVARRLAANGIRTDSIIGSLLAERKFALVEKFRAGDCTCLVLTDEGAEGLSPGVFPLIVNYDIPLEPEFFVKRLEMLDRSDPGAKVVSLACDRYIYGLPAVEQYIDAKLDALPADESMLSAIDKSEGMGGERRPKSDSYSRDARRGPPQRRDAYPRDGNNSPNIRKSISEATGGALDVSGALPPNSGYPRPMPNRSSQNMPSSNGESHGGQGRHGKGNAGGRPAANKTGRRDDSRHESGRPSQPRKAEPRQQAPRQESSRPSATQPGNPYDKPMEERMKFYREKYGHKLGEEKAGNGRDGTRNSPKKGQPGGQARQKSGQQSGQRDPRSGQRGSSQQGGGVQRPPTQRPPRPARVQESPRTPQAPKGEPERKSEGVVSRLIGALKKKRG